MELGKIKTDPVKAVEGEWFKFYDDGEFKIRAAGTVEHRRVMARVTERYRPQLRVGGDVAIDARLMIRQEVAAEYHLADWKNVSEKTVVLPPTVENKLRVCREYPEVLAFIEGSANEITPYQAADDPKVQD